MGVASPVNLEKPHVTGGFFFRRVMFTRSIWRNALEPEVLAVQRQKSKREPGKLGV